MAKGNSLSGLFGRLPALSEVKTFDNQQASHVIRALLMTVLTR